jgi:hypothetical protein
MTAVGEWIYMLAGVWGIVMLVIFIQAIRLSYRIEARSPELVNRTGIPRKAMMFHTVLNLSVARDPETQALRRRMNFLLVLNLVGFVLLWAALRWVQGAAG